MLSGKTIAICLEGHGSVTQHEMWDEIDELKGTNVYWHSFAPVNGCFVTDDLFNLNYILFNIYRKRAETANTMKLHQDALTGLCKHNFFNSKEHIIDYIVNDILKSKSDIEKFVRAVESETIPKRKKQRFKHNIKFINDFLHYFEKKNNKYDAFLHDYEEFVSILVEMLNYFKKHTNSAITDKYNNTIHYLQENLTTYRAFENEKIKSENCATFYRMNLDKTYDFTEPEKHGIYIVYMSDTNNQILLPETYNAAEDETDSDDEEPLIKHPMRLKINVEGLNKLSNIVLFLKDCGYENIFVYDITCNSIDDTIRNSEMGPLLLARPVSRGGRRCITKKRQILRRITRRRRT